MSFSRITVDKRTADSLSILQQRTGVTPNLLCRVAMSLSLEAAGVPNPELYGEDNAREFNRYTLLGDYDALALALVRERLAADDLPLEDETIEAQLRAHICRGTGMLYRRANSMAELAAIIAGSETTICRGVEVDD